ncbi:MAG TPA: hypothetical protein PLH94_08075 [Fimbriimonadaceae bacterium]|nr:hypothetical protein [Fimbriimonadaceae bacterium]
MRRSSRGPLAGVAGLTLAILAASLVGCGGGGGTGPGPGPGPNPGLRGQVVEEGSTFGIASVQVRFYDSGGALVDTLTTDAEGHFAGNVVTSATSFHVVSIPLGYHKSYVFNGKRYAPLIAGCRAPLPSLAGGNVTLAAISVPSSSFPPPPPPDGCK